jgi:hypothetical protein
MSQRRRSRRGTPFPVALLAIAAALPAVAADPPPRVVEPPAGPAQVSLEASEIRGNQELPKVLYIVPWKDPAMVEVAGRPVNSLVDEALAPVDRDVFRRQGRYFEQLYGAGRGQPPGEVPAPAQATGTRASD